MSLLVNTFKKQGLKRVFVLALAGLALGLSACAGGGSGSPVAVAPPPPGGNAASFETTEYNNNPGLGVVKTSSAYVTGATGSGIVVAVIDTGVDVDNKELVGRLSPDTTDIFASRNDANDADGHGTFVAGVIGANKDGNNVHGIAFEATVLSIRADDPGSCADKDGCTFSGPNVAQAIDYAVAHGARIINMSIGGGPEISPSTRAAQRRAAQAGVIIVASSGNDGSLVPDAPANFAADPTSLGLALAVGSIDLDGSTLSDFSNQAGDAAKDFFLVAAGADVVSLGLDDVFFVGSGTSFSSPQVAGALALVLHAFPTLTPAEAVSLLIDTADDLGDPGHDAVFGAGLLNLERAFKPVGTTTTSFGDSLKPLDTRTLFAPAGGAFGDWVSASKAFNNLLIHDKYNRGFLVDAGRASHTPLLGASLENRQGYATTSERVTNAGFTQVRMRANDNINTPYDWAAERLRNDVDYEVNMQFGRASLSFGQGYISRGSGGSAGLATLSDSNWNGASASLVSGGSWRNFNWQPGRWSFSLRQSQSQKGQFQAVGLGRYFGAHKLSAEYGITKERYGALGGLVGTRLGGDSNESRSAFLSTSWNGPVIGQWRGAARFEVNRTDIALPDTFTLLDRPYSTSWTLGLQHPMGNGQLGLTLSQPLRTETGRVAFSAPVKILKSGAIAYEDRTASLTPSGRELNMELSSRFWLGERLRLGLAARLVRDPGHIDGTTGGVLWTDLSMAF